MPADLTRTVVDAGTSPWRADPFDPTRDRLFDGCWGPLTRLTPPPGASAREVRSSGFFWDPLPNHGPSAEELAAAARHTYRRGAALLALAAAVGVAVGARSLWLNAQPQPDYTLTGLGFSLLLILTPVALGELRSARMLAMLAQAARVAEDELSAGQCWCLMSRPHRGLRLTAAVTVCAAAAAACASFLGQYMWDGPNVPETVPVEDYGHQLLVVAVTVSMAIGLLVVLLGRPERLVRADASLDLPRRPPES